VFISISAQPVMRESVCLQSSGLLVEALVSRVTIEILALEDITANESERLDTLCKKAYPLEDLFTSHHVRDPSSPSALARSC
jgi:centromere/kinetochore protein ZW10